MTRIIRWLRSLLRPDVKLRKTAALLRASGLIR
jgi:hypothetical protein